MEGMNHPIYKSRVIELLSTKIIIGLELEFDLVSLCSQLDFLKSYR